MWLMAKYPASRTRGLIRMDRLTEGEENRPHRIRTKTEVHEWLAAMTAAERGELLRQVHRAQMPTAEPTSTLPESTRPISTYPARSSGESGLLTSELGLLINLATLSTTQRVVVEGIDEGAVLHHDGGVYVLRWPDGRYKRVSRGTITALLRIVNQGT